MLNPQVHKCELCKKGTQQAERRLLHPGHAGAGSNTRFLGSEALKAGMGTCRERKLWCGRSPSVSQRQTKFLNETAQYKAWFRIFSSPPQTMHKTLQKTMLRSLPDADLQLVRSKPERCCWPWASNTVLQNSKHCNTAAEGPRMHGHLSRCSETAVSQQSVPFLRA